MSTNEIISKIEALREWESLIANAQEEAEALRDSIKAEMEKRDLEELEAGAYRIAMGINYRYPVFFPYR